MRLSSLEKAHSLNITEMAVPNVEKMRIQGIAEFVKMDDWLRLTKTAEDRFIGGNSSKEFQRLSEVKLLSEMTHYPYTLYVPPLAEAEDRLKTMVGNYQEMNSAGDTTFFRVLKFFVHLRQLFGSAVDTLDEHIVEAIYSAGLAIMGTYQFERNNPQSLAQYTAYMYRAFPYEASNTRFLPDNYVSFIFQPDNPDHTMNLAHLSNVKILRPELIVPTPSLIELINESLARLRSNRRWKEFRLTALMSSIVIADDAKVTPEEGLVLTATAATNSEKKLERPPQQRSF